MMELGKEVISIVFVFTALIFTLLFYGISVSGKYIKALQLASFLVFLGLFPIGYGLYSELHGRIKKIIAYLLLAAGISGMGFALFYLLNLQEAALNLWIMSSFLLTYSFGRLTEYMARNDPAVHRRAELVPFLFLILGFIFLTYFGFDINSIFTLFAIASTLFLWASFASRNIYFIIIFTTFIFNNMLDIIFSEFYGKSYKLDVLIDSSYFFIYSTWFFMFSIIYVEIKRFLEIKESIAKRWKGGG